MTTLSTHVLDTTRGVPAWGVPVRVEARIADGTYRLVGSATTDKDGRVKSLLYPAERLEPGEYRLTFDTDTYFGTQGDVGFYPRVTIHFVVRAATHHHVPLLLSPYGFSTYRGT